MAYDPKPVDTTGVRLTDEILALSEMLARNTHDTWARQRLNEGWRWGTERNDTRKEHPCLVPFEELPESEKAYDRATALEAIRALVALGYRIDPPDGLPIAAAPVETPELRGLLNRLAERSSCNLAELLRIWQSRRPDLWSQSIDLYLLLARRAIEVAEWLLAYDVATEGLEYWGHDSGLRHLQGLALAESGAVQRANAIALELESEGVADQEVLGLLARSYKDLYQQAHDPARRASYLRLAADTYQDAYRRTDSYWLGINAATMALLLDEDDRAAVIARSVRSQCLEELERVEEGSPDRYWPLATLGEAALVLNDPSAAESWYQQAADAGQGRYRNLSSTRRNARLLLAHLGWDTGPIEACFSISPVTVFVGPMLDAPEASETLFPAGMEAPVRAAIAAALDRLGTNIGFSSAGCGADLLFLEEMLARGGEVHVVLPYTRDRFVLDRVACAGEGWVQRFEAVLHQAATVDATGDHGRADTPVSLDYARLLLHGLACIRAEQLETTLVPLALWDGLRGPGREETARMVDRWRELGFAVELIDLADLRRENRAATAAAEPAAQVVTDDDAAHEVATEMMAILFADAVGFGRLSEDETHRFVRHFLGRIAELLAATVAMPVMKNTWGDGLYFVFHDIEDAGRFALDLCDLVRETDWVRYGLPTDLSLRVALHAGPVYSCLNPITCQPDYVGSHVSRAARIEPITPPGQVYASQAFAAVAAAHRVGAFTCDYVGLMPLPKGHGTFPTYHVRRRTGAPAPGAS